MQRLNNIVKERLSGLSVGWGLSVQYHLNLRLSLLEGALAITGESHLSKDHPPVALSDDTGHIGARQVMFMSTWGNSSSKDSMNDHFLPEWWHWPCIKIQNARPRWKRDNNSILWEWWRQCLTKIGCYATKACILKRAEHKYIATLAAVLLFCCH